MKTKHRKMSQRMKNICFVLGLLLTGPAFAQVAYVNCDEFWSSSFENGAIEPYYECTFKRPAYINGVNLNGQNCAEAWWSAAGYDGSRLDRGMEACSGDSTTELRFREDGWYGLKIRFPSGAYPTDKNCIVLQMFAHGRGGSWAGTLIVNDNRLSIEHRSWLTTNITVYELDADIERDTWIPIIIHFKPSTDPSKGKMQVWYDGAPENAPSYDYTGKFAFDGIDTNDDGSYDDDGWVDSVTMKSGIGLKWGMYCADSSNYTPDETRTIYYDDVTQLKGNPVGAWQLVNPAAVGRNAFRRIDAEYYSDQSGVVTETCTDIDGGLNLVDLQDSDSVTFYDVNFGEGATNFEARVASTNSGTIEIRLDSPTGTLLGSCPVNNTGGTQTWQTVSTGIATVSGLHDVYLTFTGGSGDLLSLNWFQFIDDTLVIDPAEPDIFFSNDLQNEVSLTNQFNANAASGGEWGFSTSPVITVLEGERTNTTSGASVYSTTSEDIDSARSYLATQYGGYSTTNWKAHVAVELPEAGDPNVNYLFFGVGQGLPSGVNFEPLDGDRVYIRWRHGSNASYGKPRTYLNGNAVDTAGVGITGPGCDVYMTYDAETATIKFELDDWNGGRSNGVDVTLWVDASTLDFTGDTEARIFFGGNATTTYSDFSVETFEVTTPGMPLSLYAWPDSNNVVTVRWDADALATLGFNVYRSLNDSDYSMIASSVMANAYVDTDVTNGVTYYYKAAGRNENGEGEWSLSDMAVPTPYFIIGTDGTYGDNPYITKHQVFDGDIDTYFDSSESGTSWTGLDYGVGNEQEIIEVRYTLRNWNSAKDRTIGAYIEASNSEDFSTSVTLHTVTTNALTYPTANIITVSDSTPYRYVRMHSNASRPLYGVAELEFLTEADFTANGTPKYWLAEYGLDESDDEIDTDSDGLLTWEEYIAGTIPNDPSSVLEMNSLSNTIDGLVISWQSVAGKDYSIITNTSLVNPAKGTAVSGITGLETETSYTTTVSGANTVFYEVDVE